MTQSTSFEEKFNSQCEMLGENLTTLLQHFGQYDEIDDSYGTTFIYYKESKAAFRLDDNETVTTLFAPVTNAMGENFTENENYYTFQGIIQGMTKSEVINIWGQPDSPLDNITWQFSSKVGYTRKGQKYDLLLRFLDPEDGDTISSFVAGVASTNSNNQESLKPKSGCFIATACYGDYNAKEVLVLREFRDDVLMNSSIGRTFVKFYYFISPPLAKFIEKSDALKKFIRTRILSSIVSKISQNQINNQ